MRKLLKISVILGLFLSGASLGQGISSYNFSRNKKIMLKQINLEGQRLLSRKTILTLADLEENSNFFIYDIEEGLARLISSGFFKNTNYNLEPLGEAFVLNISIEENPPLASIKVLDSKMLNLVELRSRLLEEDLKVGGVFSEAALVKAIDSFNNYNQDFGVFLYDVSFRVISKDEIEAAGGKFLFAQSEGEMEGLHVIIYITEIPRIFIHEIRMSGTTVSYDEILKYLHMKEKIWIDSDEELFYRYKRLKRLGFYDSVYFKLVKEPLKGPIYRLSIVTKQISTNEITTTLTAPPNIGIITAVEYYNISLFDSLQRVRVSAGWELALGAPTFLLEYTHPYFWKGFFFDATFTKSDQLEIIGQNTNRKLTNNYELKLTMGANLFGNFSSYVFQKENYSISNTVDENYDKVAGYDTLSNLFHSSGFFIVFDNLDDNFFVTQGFKAYVEYEAYWKSEIAHKFGFNGEVYLPVPVFNLIAGVANRSNILFTGAQDQETSLSLEPRMRSNVQQIETIADQQLKLTTYTTIELRFPMPEIKSIVKDYSLIIFAEAGGAWADYTLFNMAQVMYGFGAGFRLSPRKHYSSFLFQFPAGLYLGYRAGDSSAKLSLISHRDELYYINLTASF